MSTHKIIWLLEPKDDKADYLELVTSIANSRPVDFEHWKIGQVGSVVHTFREEIADHLFKRGLSSLMQDDLLLEHLITKGATPSQISSVFQVYLTKVGIDSELIIVDRFFFHSNDPNYPALVEDILKPFMSALDHLRFVTKAGGVNAATKSAIITRLQGLKTSLQITHTTSDDFHDRFWISGVRQRGLISGTSLNGYGLKYALVDRLNTSDVRAIVSQLVAQSLIP
ncbi:MAG: hypothetical protein IPI81_07765 [Flavobacteriales bacterium]|nr:hypothetical protein [Flavobacteriales bacterium]